MTKQQGNWFNREWFLEGKPTNTTFATNLSRTALVGNIAIAATGVAHATRTMPLNPGDKATNITFITGGTAANTPTAGYAALRDPSGAVVAKTADFGNTARGANTAFTVAFESAYLVTEGGLFYVEISFTAGTVPTLAGVAMENAVCNDDLGLSAPVLAQTHGSAVGATPPASIATPTTVANIPFYAIT